MELRHLRTFVAVAEELHFGAAATRLYLSPPAVTEHVHILEREIGVPLFVRGRSVSLTDAGAVLFAHARETLAHADTAVTALRELHNGRSGRFHIGILSNGAGSLTPWLIRTFMAHYPDVHVTLHRLNFIDHVSALIAHRVDVAFVRPSPEDARLAVVPLFKEGRVAVLPAEHPMAKADVLCVDEVLDEPFVGMAKQVPCSFADYLHLRDVRGGCAPRTVNEACVDVTDVLAAVAAGRGVASAVESFRGYENWPGVSYVSLLGVEPGANVLISRRDDPSPLVDAFLEMASDARADKSSHFDA